MELKYLADDFVDLCLAKTTTFTTKGANKPDFESTHFKACKSGSELTDGDAVTSSKIGAHERTGMPLKQSLNAQD